MPTLPNMSLITPTLGGDSGTWDDKINACFSLIDAHDHTTGKGVRIPVAGLDIDDDFAMGGNAVTGLGSIAFNAVAALTSGSKRLFVRNTDNELYWRTNSGTNVKLTSGTSINTTLVGGIVGDYSTVGAAVAYDDANKRYTFKTQTSTWARLASGPVRIYEYNTTESVYIEHAAAAALASSYTVTWPAALPGAQTAMQIGSTGTVVFSNAFTGAVSATGTVTATEMHFTSPDHLLLPGCMWTDGNGTHTRSLAPSGAQKGWLLASSTNKLVMPLPLKNGDVITTYNIRLNKATSSGTLSARIYSLSSVTGTETAQGSGSTINTVSPGLTSFGETGLTITVDEESQWYLVLTPTGGAAPSGDILLEVDVLFTHP